MSRHRLLFAVKILLSGSIIYALGRRFETKHLLDFLHHVDWCYWLASVLCASLAVPVVGFLWAFLARMVAVRVSFVEAVSATFAGLFVGQILPGVWFYLKRKSDKPRESLDVYSEDGSKNPA